MVHFDRLVVELESDAQSIWANRLSGALAPEANRQSIRESAPNIGTITNR
jgi:hypothetical protein